MTFSIPLPEISPARIAIKVKTSVEKIIRSNHPWIFDKGIIKQSAAGKAGDLAVIFDQKKNKFLGVGLLDPDSPIRIKMLHQGTSVQIDSAFFERKIKEAHALRQPLLKTDTNSYRLLFGENDGLPGLIADVYAKVLVVKLYSAIWLPYLKIIFPILLKISKAETLVLRLNRQLQKSSASLHGLKDGQIIYGQLPNPNVIFKEHGLRFEANVIEGHKTGYFLDHRHNRLKIRKLAEGKTVLDVFAYAGGFSVNAMAGGASEVVSLDISAQALQLAKRNIELNDLLPELHSTIVADAFGSLRKMVKTGQKFKLVIIDPPSFAKRVEEVAGALNSYQQLARLAADLVAPFGKLLLASCSSRVSADEFFEVSLNALKKSGRTFRVSEKTFHDVDHPVNFPEGAYLKSVYVEMLK